MMRTKQPLKSIFDSLCKCLLPLLPLILVAGTANGQATFTLLYSFQGGADGDSPRGIVTPAGDSVYGTTVTGGGSGCYQSLGCGTIFSVNTNTKKEKVIYSFGGAADGSAPEEGVVAFGGKGYGTTALNCTSSFCPASTIFQLSTGKLTTLYTFGSGGPNDASGPSSPLVAGSSGNLYGVSELGGNTSCEVQGCGTVYQYNLNTNKETILYSFLGGSDGFNPTVLLRDPATGNLYGVTSSGGMGTGCTYNNCGTVFKLSQSGGTWTGKCALQFQGSTRRTGSAERD
jgi:uncharacterized repeat protein (TIGR03803 family)